MGVVVAIVLLWILWTSIVIWIFCSLYCCNVERSTLIKITALWACMLDGHQHKIIISLICADLDGICCRRTSGCGISHVVHFLTWVVFVEVDQSFCLRFNNRRDLTYIIFSKVLNTSAIVPIVNIGFQIRYIVCGEYQAVNDKLPENGGWLWSCATVAHWIPLYGALFIHVVCIA